jgi:oxygen-independent coproporphyrinogen-3 oxidase
MTEARRDPAGLYVHIPFCLTRCGYCDFNTYEGLDHMANAYVDAVAREAELGAPAWRAVPFRSMFFGGGTPTMLPAPVLLGLLGRLRTAFDVEPGAEVTTEANPDTVGERYLSELLEGGVSRLSIGVQSFDPVVLEALERIHSPESARSAFASARRAGFDDVNLDLIYGANGETLASWRRTLTEAVELHPEHLSCYALTIEPATPLGRKVAAGLVPAPDPDTQAEMYDLACAVLADAGYEHYEVSNWALPGHRCVHNMGYWEGRPYLGLGAGAHSYRDGRRWWNVRPPHQYVEVVGAGRLPIGGEEHLTSEESRMERLLLGLRLADGVPAGWVDAVRAGPYLEEGLAERRGGRFALTDRGMLLANEATLALDDSSCIVVPED